jgi:hypothetical protein
MFIGRFKLTFKSFVRISNGSGISDMAWALSVPANWSSSVAQIPVRLVCLFFVGQENKRNLHELQLRRVLIIYGNNSVKSSTSYNHQTSMTATLRLHVTTVELGQFGQHRLQFNSARSTIQIVGFWRKWGFLKVI